MDTLLIDIKNFLKKLESGQLDIEAGQWELHKDIANMKKSVEELKKLKEDVEVMRMNNIEQKELIKNLEAKLEMFGTHMKSDDPVTVSQSSVEYETVYRVPANEKMPPKGYKKRKCHRVRSEEIIEITSNMSDKKSASSNSRDSVLRHQESPMEKEVKNEQPSDNSNPNVCHTHVEVTPVQQSPKVRYQSHPGNAILQRYLKDSVRYRDREISHSSDLSRTLSNPSEDSTASKNDTECSNFWDEYGSRQHRAHLYRKPSGAQRQTSSASDKTIESVMPKRLLCSKNAKKSNCKSEFVDQEPQNQTKRRTRAAKHIYRCEVCGKGFSCRNLLRMHRFNHESSTRKTKGFKCSYCDKVCNTPENLTLHLKNCRIIMRSHYRRR